jgi:serine-type D-Ala-D-Ala carboxypeptidase (penicillin-binding protein 5/6)
MNKTAERLGLKYSIYDSPHGLSNTNNKTSALDIAKLSTEAMKNKKFREIVSTKYMCVKKNTNGNRKTYKWYNTHLMLGQRGINGIKTGITPNAGPCLCTSICNDDFEIIVVVICTKNMDIRWPETWKLANWTMNRLKTIAKFQHAQDTNDPIQHKRLLQRIRHL